MNLAIYHRDDQGLVTYHGEQEWDCREDVLDEYCQPRQPDETELMYGWSHPAVTWHGRIGFGEGAA